MRPKDFGDPVKNAELSRHIIEVFSGPKAVGIKLTEPLEALIASGANKVVSSSPEAALLLRDTIDITYLPTKHLTPTEKMFSSVIKRKEESIDEYSIFATLLEEFNKTSVNKFFNIDLFDYLSLTPFERNMIIKASKKYAEELYNIMKDSEKAASKSSSKNNVYNDNKFKKAVDFGEISNDLDM